MGRLLARNFSGPSIKFDGSATKIVSANALDLNSGATMCGWVNTTFPASMRLIGATTSGGLSFGITVGNRLGFVKASVISIGNGYVSSLLPKNKWVFIAGSYSNSGQQVLYVNGALVVSEISDQHPLTSSTHIVGGELVSNYQSGYIAEPAIFNRVLTAEEIRAIYEQGPSAYPKDGSCVLDYRFKEGAVGGIAGEIIDYSGKGNHGQLTMGSGKIDPYAIPVPNRILIPGNMPLVGIESTGANGLSITDANIAAAFGVAAGEVGINGISGGAWIKKKRHVTNYQAIVSKNSFGATGYGGKVDSHTNINSLNPISYGPSSVSVTDNNKNYNNYSHATWINGISYGECFHAGIKTRHETKTLAGNGASAFSLITAAASNITTVALPFLANRALTDSEVYNIYSKSTFPPDVLFWHGPDETGTKIACYRGSYYSANRIPSCDGTLPVGIAFTDDVPWR